MKLLFIKTNKGVRILINPQQIVAISDDPFILDATQIHVSNGQIYITEEQFDDIKRKLLEI